MDQYIKIQLRTYFEPERTNAEARYAMLRQVAYEDVHERLLGQHKRYRLDDIGFSALRTFEEVWKLHPRRVKWDWVSQVKYWKRKRHSRLELAIWHDMHLCGLLLGSTSRRKNILYIRGIEGAPYKHPLKGRIIPLCIEVAETYADAIRAKEIRIVAPDSLLIPKYELLGYNFRSSFIRSPYSVKVLGEQK